MLEDRLVSARDLHDFAGGEYSRELSRGLLPVIVRRLIGASSGVRGLVMPGGDEVWRDGWDGLVEEADGDAFVPAGLSVWEMSNAGRTREKAEEDYRKRSADPSGVDRAAATFVFVTMRRWRGKQRWLADRRQEGIWRHVVVKDSDDLHAWLESKPAVHRWVSEKLLPLLRGRERLPGPAQLPADIRGFSGRASELQQLARLVHGSTGGLVVITGQPGVGKTALAIHLGHRQIGSYPDGQLYVDLRGGHDDAMTRREVLKRVLRSLGLADGDQPESCDELAAVFRGIVADRRVMIILDNAASEEQVRLLSPGLSKSLVVVVSRHHLGGLDCDLRVRLGVLASDEAAAMLAAQVGGDRVEAEPDAVADLAHLCGYLPLALRVAGGLVARTPWRPSQIVERLADEHERLDGLKIGDVEVRASFQLSYEMLSDELKTAFRRISLVPGPTFGWHLIAAVTGSKDKGAAIDVIHALADRGLVEPALAEGRFRMHDLLRLFGREKLDADDAPTDRVGAQRRLRGHLIRFSVEAGFALEATGRQVLANTRNDVAKAGAALQWFDENIDNVDALLHEAIADGAHNEALTMMLPTGMYLELRASWERLSGVALSGLEIIADIRKKGTLNGEFAVAVESSLWLMLAKASQGLRMFDDALEQCDQASRLAELDEPTQAVIQNVRGSLLRSQHRHDEALAEFRKAAAYWEANGDEVHLCMVAHNIGASLMDLGRPAEALEFLHRDLHGCRRLGDRLGEAHTLNSIGLAWIRLGRFDEASRALQIAVKHYRDENDTVHEGHALNDLGLLYFRSCDYVKAYECHVLDLAYCEVRRDRRGAALALIRLADSILAIDIENAQQALAYLKVAKNHLRTVDDLRADLALLVVLAEVGFAIGRVDDAVRQLDTAVHHYRRLGDTETEVAVSERLCRHLIEQGQTAAAVERIQDLVEATRAREGYSSVQALSLLAEALSAHGRQAEADEAVKEFELRLKGLPSPPLDEEAILAGA